MMNVRVGAVRAQQQAPDTGRSLHHQSDACILDTSLSTASTSQHHLTLLTYNARQIGELVRSFLKEKCWEE